MHFNKNGSMMVRGSTNMDTTRHDGPNHLGLWCDALPEHQMALITSDCAAFSTAWRSSQSTHPPGYARPTT